MQRIVKSFERSVADAIDGELLPAVVVHRGGDLPEALVGCTHRQAEIMVSVLTNDVAPDALADTVLEVAHPIVMACCLSDSQLTDVEEGLTEPPIFDFGNGENAVITVHYFFKYRTAPESLVA
ncbi:hypothetical protein [Pandoraea commovens]|uniref:Uncharacterized protein n=1 Tax=Pandoraea commovens TaxID=2508289 RepID=A0ABY5QJ34_9BURK|nr:hypothetical protein [Pandoraea commovens]UVA80465.1 hypothetical protein NTU39_05430 [Pandoraea commovens]